MGFKIYIMTDMEGISGIRRPEECKPSHPSYQQACRYFERDVNTAIAAAFDGGATEVVVCDAHHGGFNLNINNMDSRATYVEFDGIKAMMGQLDDTFDGYFNIGHHAKAGTINAFYDHTQCPDSVYNFEVNGISLGEIGQQMLLAGHYGVPQLMISGDKAACEESLDLYPESLTCIVKEAYGHGKVACKHPDQVQEDLYEVCKNSLELIGKIEPFILEPPFDIRLTLTKTIFADDIYRKKPWLERIDGRTLRYLTNNISEILFPF